MAAKESSKAGKHSQPSDGTRQVRPWKAENRDTERNYNPYYKKGKKG